MAWCSKTVCNLCGFSSEHQIVLCRQVQYAKSYSFPSTVPIFKTSEADFKNINNIFKSDGYGTDDNSNC